MHPRCDWSCAFVCCGAGTGHCSWPSRFLDRDASRRRGAKALAFQNTPGWSILSYMHDSSPPSDGAPRGGIPVWIKPTGWLFLLVIGIYFLPAIGTVALGWRAACVIASTLRPLMKYIPGPRGIDVAVLALGMLAIVALVGLALSWPLRGPFDRAMAKWPETRVQVDAALKTWSEKIGISPPLAVDVLMGGVRDFLTGQGTQVLSRGAEVLL